MLYCEPFFCKVFYFDGGSIQQEVMGLTLLVNERESVSVENEKTVGPNVISFEFVTGKKERWYVVRCYLPPSNRERERMRRALQALKEQSKGTRPLVIIDLNADIDNNTEGGFVGINSRVGDQMHEQIFLNATGTVAGERGGRNGGM